ncbi:hypothetical protein [uncultured Shewanella sp.]|uniref:hypothetical protein n=1 Tax=uncultured Shewanella sp. TaxID=173975 RepID=UPI00262CDEA9|nr:hypothetical protein [uncultured Shewanella sp.]
MKSLFSALIIGSALFFATFTHATVIQDVCDTCVTERQYEQRVIELIDSNGIRAIPEPVYIFNFKSGALKKYNASSEVVSDAGRAALEEDTSYFVIPINVTSLQQLRFDRSVELYSAAKSSVQDERVPSSVVDSAYSLVGAGYKENDLADYYNANRRLQDQFTALLATAASVTGELPRVQMDVEVKFSDGTTAIVLLTKIDKNGTLRLKFVEGKDVDNNTITNDPKNYTSGSYNFTKQGEEGVRKIMEAAARLGLPIYNGGSSGSIGGGQSMSCSYVGDDYICTITKDPV